MAGWLDLASEADCPRLPPSLTGWKAGQEDQESTAGWKQRGTVIHRITTDQDESDLLNVGNVNLLCGLGSFEDLEMGNLSVQVYLHLQSHHLNQRQNSIRKR